MTDGAPLAPRAGRARGATIIALLAAGCAAPEGYEPRPELSLDLGGAKASDAEALLGGVGLAVPVAPRWTVGARVVGYDFEMTETGTLEANGFVLDTEQKTTGTGVGGGLELRYYPRAALHGFWLGAGALWFPWTDFESRGTATERTTGMTFSMELEPESIDFVPYGALGWTFRLGGPWSLGLRAAGGRAADEPFGTLGLQLGLSL